MDHLGDWEAWVILKKHGLARLRITLKRLGFTGSTELTGFKERPARGQRALTMRLLQPHVENRLTEATKSAREFLELRAPFGFRSLGQQVGQHGR